MLKPRAASMLVVAVFNPHPDPRLVAEAIPGSRLTRALRGVDACIVRVKPGLTVTFYKKRVVVAGARSMREARLSLQSIQRQLKARGFTTRLESIRLANATFHAQLPGWVDLQKLALALNGLYDPDYLPFLTARIHGASVVVSQQGRVVILYSRGLTHAQRVLDYLYARAVESQALLTPPRAQWPPRIHPPA